jgi:hypothetical protein
MSYRTARLSTSSPPIVVALVLVVSMVGWTRAPTASAINCLASHTFVDAQPSPVQERRGVASNNMQVYDRAIQCDLVEDVGLQQDVNNQLEVGWFDLVDQENAITHDASCRYTIGTNPPPHIAVINTIFGAQTCVFASISLTTGLHSFKALQDSGTTYKVDIDGGGHVTFVTVNFGSNNFAFPLTNSERYQTVDDMTANFSGLRYRTSAGWVDWASPIVRCDTDTGYNNMYISPTHVRVASPGTFVQC